MEHKSDNYTNYDWCSWYSHQRIIKGTGGLGNKRASGDHTIYNIIENGQNTEKRHGDLKRLVVNESPSPNENKKCDKYLDLAKELKKSYGT